MAESDDLVLRARSSAFLVFAMIAGIPTLVAFVAGLVRGGEAWKLAALCAAGLRICLLWLSAFRLTLSNETITYRRLLGGTKSLPLADIRSAQILIGSFDMSDRFKPTLRLTLWSRGNDNPPLVINMRVFAAERIDRVLEQLERRGVLDKRR
jgi:hypothetical protein